MVTISVLAGAWDALLLLQEQSLKSANNGFISQRPEGSLTNSYEVCQ